ncbi:MAG: hypothetical protein QOH50_377 [Kribbellaceae bacterium]|nr:hypothetical protein [Kribbellaceae bacterium]
MNAACSAGMSPANDAGNFSRSWNRKPSFGGRIGDTGASGRGSAMSVFTDSPSSGANAAMYTSAAHVQVYARLGDDRPAVGVADENDRPVLRADDLPRRCDVPLERAQMSRGR